MKLQKELDTLHDEKLYLQSETDRLKQNAEQREMSLHTELDRCSLIREELLTAKEELNKLYLSHDLLEQQKLEADALVASLEKSKFNYQMELERVLGERSNVCDTLAKNETATASLENDNRKLVEALQKVRLPSFILIQHVWYWVK